MGFNIQQYEMGDSYSNVSGNDALRGAGTICVKGNPIYLPPIYAGLQITKKGREKISENRQICQARYASKQGSAESVSTDVSTASVTAPSSTVALTSGTTDTTKSNTGMYIGIGVGVLVVGILAIVLIKKSRN